MSNLSASELTKDCKAACDVVGELEQWLQQKCNGTVPQDVLDETFVQLTRDLLDSGDPRIPAWDHLMVATASCPTNGQHAYHCCKTAITELISLMESDSVGQFPAPDVITIASALTMVLAAQRKLHQPIEIAMKAICERFETLVPDIAERCQAIWQRQGQMTGLKGLFVWDTRQQEWRLSQDFRTYREASK